MSPEQFMREHGLHIRKVSSRFVTGSDRRIEFTYEVYRKGMKRGEGYTTYFSPAPSMDVSTHQARTAVARELICVWMSHVCDKLYWTERGERYGMDDDEDEQVAEGMTIRDLFGEDVYSDLHNGLVETE